MKSQATDHNFLDLWQSLIDSAHVSIFWKDTSLKYIACSALMASWIGLDSYHEIVGKSDNELVWAKNADEIQANDRLVLSTLETHSFQEVAVDHDGNPIYVYSVKSPYYDQAGVLRGIVGIAFQIKDLFLKQNMLVQTIADHKLEQAIQRKAFLELYENISGVRLPVHTSVEMIGRKIRDFFEMLISKLPANIVWYTLDGINLGCNDNVARFYGFKDRHDVVGKRNEDILSPEALARLRVEDAQVLKHDGVTTLEQATPKNAMLVRGKSEYAYWLTHKTVINSEEGEPAALLSVSLDITERKLMEEALRHAKEQAEAANLAKLHFLNNMRHDLRTPLGCIVGSARILDEMETDPEKKEFIHGILTSSEHLLQMLTNMLEYDRVNSQEKPLKWEPVRMTKLAQDLIEMLALTAHGKGIALALEVAPDVPATVVTDSYRIQRVLLNILNNAVKFTQQGKVLVRLSVKGEDVSIEVIDTGIGIPKEKQALIFNQFVRLNPGGKDAEEGQGLGLAIVQQYVTELLGNISVESTPGLGSTFTIMLPLSPAGEVHHEGFTG